MMDVTLSPADIIVACHSLLIFWQKSNQYISQSCFDELGNATLHFIICQDERYFTFNERMMAKALRVFLVPKTSLLCASCFSCIMVKSYFL